ncbi:hypothetical protein [Ancylobacter amanitiformis]|uniref:Uncharacterized protein n=1 Tax=Ancylobacter amanitiformis TaxID=217069 RepID=A0ABU0LMG7_9HYPH|nr:hypothetical protein [Ancylobacter amanitiformis]MDQ0509899.1 hypothetical protein [Ancylobacter amanitiformis]
MVYVISKQDGPRKEDVVAKRVIRDNWQTIDRLANQLSGGHWNDIKRSRNAPVKTPEEQRKSLLGYAPTGRRDEPRPYVRISANNRVVIVDEETSRQMLFVGELRTGAEGRQLRLAIRANGFFDPLSDEVQADLADLEGALIADEDGEERLKQLLAERLGFAPSPPTATA